MITKRYLNSGSCVVAIFLISIASCAPESLEDMATTSSQMEPRVTYSFCTDQTSYPTASTLVSSDLVGEYAKTRELVCGVAGCEEVPSVSVQFLNSSPNLILSAEGQFSNPNGPFENYEIWALLPATPERAPNRLELSGTESLSTPLLISILDAGKCLLRIENGQGWIEYVRLDRV